jgi:hypothetical protein
MFARCLSFVLVSFKWFCGDNYNPVYLRGFKQWIFLIFFFIL